MKESTMTRMTESPAFPRGDDPRAHRQCAADAARSLRLALHGSQAVDVLNVVLVLPCLAWTGSFIVLQLAEPRFWVAAAVLHVWLVAICAAAVSRFARRSLVRLDAPMSEIQGQMEAIGRFSWLALRVLLVSGVLVVGAPLAIVVARASLGIDLYALSGSPQPLVVLLAGSVAAALVTLSILARFRSRPSPMRGLA
jgi:hypothetical protein